MHTHSAVLVYSDKLTHADVCITSDIIIITILLTCWWHTYTRWDKMVLKSHLCRIYHRHLNVFAPPRLQPSVFLNILTLTHVLSIFFHFLPQPCRYSSTGAWSVCVLTNGWGWATVRRMSSVLHCACLLRLFKHLQRLFQVSSFNRNTLTGQLCLFSYIVYQFKLQTEMHTEKVSRWS